MPISSKDPGNADLLMLFQLTTMLDPKTFDKAQKLFLSGEHRIKLAASGKDLSFETNLTADELRNLFKAKLAEKRPIFEILKKLFQRDVQETDKEISIPRDLEIDAQGNVTGRLPPKPFKKGITEFAKKCENENFLKFFENEKLLERFEKDIHHTIECGGITINIAQTVGVDPITHEHQEDTCAVGICKIPANIEAIEAHVKLMKSNVEKRIEEENLKSGSTALLFFYLPSGEQIIFNCGDSRASSFTYRDGKVEEKALSTDHDLEKNAVEIARIKDSGGTILTITNPITGKNEQRIVGNKFHPDDKGTPKLNLARSIGDVAFKYKGLSSKFDIITLPATNEEGFFSAASDGLEVSDKDYAKKAEENWSQIANQNFAEFLVNRAVDKGTTDNVTAITAKTGRPPEQMVGFAVFDGHGGKEVAEILAEEFGRIFLQDLTKFVSTEFSPQKLASLQITEATSAEELSRNNNNLPSPPSQTSSITSPTSVRMLPPTPINTKTHN